MKDLWIDTKVAFEPGRKLAFAYNRAMENTTAEWVLFIDQDLFICNPKWYKMSLSAIEQVGGNAGWITAKCNRIGSGAQRFVPPKDPNDVLYHIEIAKQLYKTHGNEVKLVTGKLSGFFILTSKKAWKDAGGFRDRGKGLSKVDRDYCVRIRKAGYKTYVMPGLYFFHLYKKGKQTIYKGF